MDWNAEPQPDITFNSSSKYAINMAHGNHEGLGMGAVRKLLFDTDVISRAENPRKTDPI
jgi:hypothetical protein